MDARGKGESFRRFRSVRGAYMECGRPIFKPAAFFPAAPCTRNLERMKVNFGKKTRASY